jgi:hypothetical protein
MAASKNPKSKTIPKSFRIDESALIAIEKEAVAQNLSQNTLVNQILKQFSEFDRFAKRINTVKLSGSIFRDILSKVDAEIIIEVAKTAGSSIPQAFATAKSGRADLVSFLDHIRSLAMYAHLCGFTETINTHSHTATLVHDFGLNWSIFLIHYLTAMYEQLGITPKFEMSDRSVTFSIPEGPR